jgi:uncharacterized membrane protein
VFGWYEYPMPLTVIVVSYLTLLLAIGVGLPRSCRTAIVSSCSAIIVLLLIMTACYLDWTPVGESVIGGLQGRYFIPVLPLLIFLSLSGEPPKLDRSLFLIAALVSIFSVVFLAQIFYPAFPVSRFYFRLSG